MNKERLSEILNNFPQRRIAVIGDFFLDKYFDLDRNLSETSLETGLEAYQAFQVRCSPGAAGNVAANLAALEVQTLAFGIVGEDGEGYELKNALQKLQIETSNLITVEEIHTPTYIKPLMHEPNGQIHELNRIDIRSRKPLSLSLQKHIVEALSEVVRNVDGFVVNDQIPESDYGLITTMVRRTIISLAKQNPDKIIAVDSRLRARLFRDVILKPNIHEAFLAVGKQIHPDITDSDIKGVGSKLFAMTGKPVFITMGEKGIIVFDEQIKKVPAMSIKKPVDTVGAGDSAMAGIVAALSSGATLEEAALIGNLVASITIQQIGTTGTASRTQLFESFSYWQNQNEG